MNPEKHKTSKRGFRSGEGSTPTQTGREGLTAHIANKVEATGRMARYVAHEIRNPLAIINSNAQYALDYLRHAERYDNKILEESLTAIIGAVQLANKFVSELAELHSLEFQKKETNIRPIIKKAIDLLKVEIDRKKIRVSSEFLSRIPKVMADKEKLKHAFVNILLNAIQAVKTGGSVEIKARTDVSTKSVIVQFEDTGHGIPEEYIEKIFEPFVSLKDGCKGIGLAICSMIINAHGGTINAKNMAKGGAIFTVVLPM
ncbi:MAG: ATP-binding protein [Candidatus Brocadiales bacterium]|nr:GHKL domain-containing protein [Planctomycetota bacterium]MDO8091953.1 ATP-binding protein [Candidatus Brocadiales bacterium]